MKYYKTLFLLEDQEYKFLHILNLSFLPGISVLNLIMEQYPQNVQQVDVNQSNDESQYYSHHLHHLDHIYFRDT